MHPARALSVVAAALALAAPAAAATPGTATVEGYGALTEGGKPVTPFGGEVEYYRLDPANWGKVLDAARETADTVTTYVPWNWHALGPDDFDFTGRTDPRRDLVRWVRMAGDRDLRIVLRPGPWIVNEWPDGGNPGWLTGEDRADELRMRGSEGDGGQTHAAAYAAALGTPLRYTSTAYRDAIAAWYHAFAGAIGPLQAPAGPITGVQVDNETSFYFNGDPFSFDYHPETVAEFKRRTGDDAPRAFPEPGDAELQRKLLTAFRWQRFRAQQTGEFLGFLAARMRAEGIHVPLSTNGQSLNLTFDAGYRDLARRGELLITNDTYVPAQATTSAEMRDAAVRASWQDQLMRGFNPDAPAGMAEVGIVSYAPAFGVFEPGGVGTLTAAEALSLVDMNTRLHLAQGMASMGYYMLAGRDDPPDRSAPPARDPAHSLGFAGLSMALGRGTAIATDGSRRPHFAVMREAHRMVAANQPLFAAGRPLLPVAIGWHAGAYHAPPEASRTGLMGDVLEHGVRGVPYAVIDPLRAAGFVPAAAVLDDAPASELARHAAIVLPQTDYLAAGAQDALAAYVRDGGRLIAFPRLPARDGDLAPDDRLAQALLPGVRVAGTVDGPVTARTDEGPVRLFGPVTYYDVPAGSDVHVLGRNDAGHAVALERGAGRGRVVVLGGLLAGEANPTPADLAKTGDSAEDPVKLDPAAGPFVRRLLARLGVSPPAAAERDPARLETIQRRRGRSALLLVDNYTSQRVDDRVRYADPRTGRERLTGPLSLPARSGLALPLQREVAPGLVVASATAEIRTVRSDGSATTLALWSPPEQNGAEVELRVRGTWDAAGTRTVRGTQTVRVGKGATELTLTRLPCASRRRLRVTAPRGARLVRADLRGPGVRRRLRIRGRRVAVDLRRRPAGVYRVRLLLRGRDGMSVVRTRTFRTCVPRRR